MDPSLSKQGSSQCLSSPRRTRSLRILTTVKGLVQRRTTRFVSQKLSGSARSQGDAFRRAPQHKSSPPEVSWKRRGQTPEMDEYLTLTELESVWNTQDSYGLCVCAPQNVTQYTFQEAVELPLIAKHDLRSRPMESMRLESVQRDRIPQKNIQDGSTGINGAIHPALRPNPYLSDEELTRYQTLPPRLIISVPNTNWTYGKF